MNAREMIMALEKAGVLAIVSDKNNIMEVEDSESYAGSAFIHFNDKGDVVKVEKA